MDFSLQIVFHSQYYSTGNFSVFEYRTTVTEELHIRRANIIYTFLTSLPPWFSLLFRPWVSTFLPLFIFRANSLAPFDMLLISNDLPISLLRHLWTRSQGKGGDDRSGFFRLQGHCGVLGSLCLLSARMHLRKEMRVHGMIRQVASVLSGCWPGNIVVKLSLGDLLYSRRNKLNKKVKDTCPKDWEKQKSSRGARQENQD